MKRLIVWLPFSAALRALAFISVFSTIFFAGDLKAAGPQLIATEGSGTSTITSLDFNPDGTISIVAEQIGTLSHLGKFDGSFSYLATIDPNAGTTLLNGTGFLAFTNGDRLFVAVTIIEFGLDYPKPYVGGITVTGGTGKFAGARGFLETTGIDGESLTDSFKLVGIVTTVR